MKNVLVGVIKNIRNVVGDKMKKRKKFSDKCFSCPLSPYILWHHGLTYAECPLAEVQRDMGACERCKLRGKGEFKKAKRRSKKKTAAPVEKRAKGPIPKIGKTYTSK